MAGLKAARGEEKSSSSHVPNLLQAYAKMEEFKAELRAQGDSPAGSQARSSRGRKPPASQTSMLPSQQPHGNDAGCPVGSAGKFLSLPAA